MFVVSSWFIIMNQRPQSRHTRHGWATLTHRLYQQALQRESTHTDSLIFHDLNLALRRSGRRGSIHMTALLDSHDSPALSAQGFTCDCPGLHMTARSS